MVQVLDQEEEIAMDEFTKLEQRLARKTTEKDSQYVL
jgi:hypothetical protein